MTKKSKKIISIAASAVALTALVAGLISGTHAFFVDQKSDNTDGTAGNVEIKDEQISINNISAYITGNGVDIDMCRYINSSAAIEGTNGWIAEGTKPSTGTVTNVQYKPVWEENYEGTTSYLFPNFFRTKNGEVAYCVDYGKIEPSDGVCNMNSPVSLEIKRILKTGYPQKSGADYGISDAELEWCTQMAIYIAEGTYFDTDAEEYQNHYALTLEDFGGYYQAVDVEGEASAEKILEVINQLVDNSKKSDIAIDEFKLNSSAVGYSVKNNNSIVGPYTIDSTFSEDISLSASNASVTFVDESNNALSSVKAGQKFYVSVPNNVNEDITFTASIAGKKVVPSYYYWSGRITEQKMAVGSLMDATITAHVNSIDELMPGDAVDISWAVENIGNKSILTRNTIYLYWEGDKVNDSDFNGNETIFLYKQNASLDEIKADMLTKTPTSEKLINIGTVGDYNLKDTTIHGYKFRIDGDTLDGVGNGAETGVAQEVNYGSEYDETDSIKDVVSYKLALSQWANIKTSGQKLHIVVVTEAMQYQNTTDAEWEEVAYTDYTLGQ